MEENATMFYQGNVCQSYNPSLIVIEKQSDKVYTIDLPEVMTIGRKNKKMNADIVFESDIVSRNH